ncbi:MAG: hypothetical protein MJZ37_00210 [Bacilli bacterium]|nr:hypothetical protein [Bacilli bacterium]
MIVNISQYDFEKLMNCCENIKNGYLVNLLNGWKEQEEQTVEAFIVRWIDDDFIKYFEEEMGRKPTSEELENFKSYACLEEAGGESAIACGWERIYSAFDEWKNDNIGEDE